MNHQLDLVLSSNCKNIVVQDASTYVQNSLLPIEKPTLFVLSPGQTVYVEIPFKIKASTVINAYSLKIQPESLGTYDMGNLPDGLYLIRYALCPFERMYVEKIYFHTCKLDSALNKERVKSVTCCETKNLDELERLYEALKSAVGIGNYEQAQSLYDCLKEKLYSC